MRPQDNEVILWETQGRRGSPKTKKKANPGKVTYQDNRYGVYYYTCTIVRHQNVYITDNKEVKRSM